jgi:hypothetical protein
MFARRGKRDDSTCLARLEELEAVVDGCETSLLVPDGVRLELARSDELGDLLLPVKAKEESQLGRRASRKTRLDEPLLVGLLVLGTSSEGDRAKVEVISKTGVNQGEVVLDLGEVLVDRLVLDGKDGDNLASFSSEGLGNRESAALL